MRPHYELSICEMMKTEWESFQRFFHQRSCTFFFPLELLGHIQHPYFSSLHLHPCTFKTKITKNYNLSLLYFIPFLYFMGLEFLPTAMLQLFRIHHFKTWTSMKNALTLIKETKSGSAHFFRLVCTYFLTQFSSGFFIHDCSVFPYHSY